jgi:hypothetical protein
MMKALSIVCILALSFSCKSTHYTPRTYRSAQITVGSSGGVTGSIKEFTLLDNGQLFVSKGVTGEIKEMKAVGRSETNRIFKRAEEAGLATLKFNHPGNMTYFLILRNPSKSNAIKWGESGISPPPGSKGILRLSFYSISTLKQPP